MIVVGAVYLASLSKLQLVYRQNMGQSMYTLYLSGDTDFPLSSVPRCGPYSWRAESRGRRHTSNP